MLVSGGGASRSLRPPLPPRLRGEKNAAPSNSANRRGPLSTVYKRLQNDIVETLVTLHLTVEIHSLKPIGGQLPQNHTYC